MSSTLVPASASSSSTFPPPIRTTFADPGRPGPSRSRQLVSRAVRCLGGALALVGFLTVFGIFGVTPDGTGLLQGIDTRLAAAIHVRSWHPTSLTAALGSPVLIGILAVAVTAFRWHVGHRVSQRLRPLVITAGAGVLAWVTGQLVRRPGPGHLGDLTARNATSFPSVPLAMVTGLSVAFWATRPSANRTRHVVLATSPMVLLVLLRLLTGSSWPFDEFAGVLVGLVVGHVTYTSRPRANRAHRGHASTKTIAALVVLAMVALPGRSYAQILTAPGNAAFDQRTVEWLRDNGMTQLVDRAESWWLWRHLPSTTATISRLPDPPVAAPANADRTTLPSAVTSVIQPALPGEGQWNVLAAGPQGQVQIAAAYFRPDIAHPSLVAAVAWINMSTTKVTLIAGTREPGGGPGPAGGHVPTAALDSLLAAFNSGYKMKDTPGGALIEGRATRSMVNGLATLAIRPDGTATIGEWGTDLTADQGFTGLRQNLHMMVVNGAVVDGVATNAGGRWGTVRNTLPTWRSGLGVTATGNLVYVAGNNLTLGVLGNALVEAGAVDAMELDIHNGMVAFNLFTQHPDVQGHKLLPNMPRSADRYLTTDWRDFIMVTSR